MALIFLLSLLSGCISTKQIQQKMEEFFKKEEYEWVIKIDNSEDFGWFDMINWELAKVDKYPFIVQNNTRYLHIFVEVNFSNPINPKYKKLSQGKVNITISSPEKNYTKCYSTLGKSNKYEEFFNFASPYSGKWEIIIKVTGMGKYRLIVKTYQPA